jgi:hypothetical protein
MTLDTEHREFTVPLFPHKQVTEVPLLCVPHNVGFIFFCLYTTQISVQKIFIFFYLYIFELNTKTLLLGRKNNGGALATLAPPQVPLMQDIPANVTATRNFAPILQWRYSVKCNGFSQQNSRYHS